VDELGLLGKLGWTDDGLVLIEPSVGLLRVRRLRFDPGAVRQRQLVHGIADTASLSPCADAEYERRAVASTDEDVLRPRGTVDEVPGAQPSLFAFDQEQALTGQYEEVLLGIFSVVQRARLAGTQDAHAEADLVEACVLGLEHGVEAATVSLEPRHVARVDDKPTLSGRTYTGLYPLKECLGNHPLQFIRGLPGRASSEWRWPGQVFTNVPRRKRLCSPAVAVRVERVDFVSFLTTDIARAKRFYTELLGLEIESEGEHDIEFRAGQVTLDIFDPSSIGQPFAPSPAGLSLRVPDVAAARTELEARGVEFDGDTLDTGVCHMASFRDPDGNALMLHRRYAPYEDGRQP
jgi:catechol 2,3-dioxygenase-like lactoylglutathione lyase family enzyme